MAPGREGELDRDFRVLMSLAHGFMVSQVLFAALDLGIFDLAAQGPVAAEAVAQTGGWSPRGTQLLMDACTRLGLLRGAGDGSYTNSALSSTFLVSGSPQSQRCMLLYLAGTTYGCWAHLAAGVRSEPERLLFMRGLQETWSLCGGRVLTAFDLSRFRVICDLGGGSGALAQEAARLYPGSSVCVFDLPDVIAAARTHFLSPGARPSVRFVAGDFFRSRLPRADLFILARVLHDWADGACVELLGRLHRACRPGGALLLVEAVLAKGGAGPLRSLLLSLNMMLQAEGWERQASDYRNLATRAGFPRLQLRRPGGPYHAMLARRGPRPGIITGVGSNTTGTGSFVTGIRRDVPGARSDAAGTGSGTGNTGSGIMLQGETLESEVSAPQAGSDVGGAGNEPRSGTLKQGDWK
uniref:Acetylserotonin O-methyltransferase n=1 Tax=Rattus norvegicus TaxID=10116 RepID=A0ABK0LYF5_RAT